MARGWEWGKVRPWERGRGRGRGRGCERKRESGREEGGR